VKTLTKILSLALVYALAGKLGLRLASVNASATAVWPPTGIALAAFLLLGYRVWPGVLLGAFMVNLATAGTAATSFGIAVGNTLEGVLACYLVNRFANGRRAFDHPYDIFKYAVLAAMGSTLVAATLGVMTLVLGGFARWADFGPIWLTWWLGDAGGNFIVAPLLVLWSVETRFDWSQKKIMEAGLMLLALGLTGQFVFGGFLPISILHYPSEFLCIPVILWAAFRLGKREAATATFLLSALAIVGTLRGFGPFARASQNDSLLLLQIYMGVVSIMSLAVAAVVSERRRAQEDLETKVQERTTSLMNTIGVLEEEIEERRRAEAALHTSEDRFRRLMESNVIGMMVVDGEGRILEGNDAFLEMVGYAQEDMRRGALNTGTLTSAEYHVQEAWALEQLNSRGSCPALEKEFIHRGGSRIAVLVGGVRLDQAPLRSIFFVIDATHRRQAMDALRRAYDEIELRVENRTKELSKVNTELSQEILKRQQAEAELRNLSLSDPLTGLYNRRGFLALAEQQWLQAFRDKRPFLLFFADVDGLKQINDTLGHSRGDQALIETAEALRETFRKSDILARIGGDEFAIVATQLPLEHAPVYRSRLQNHIDRINTDKNLPFRLSLSVGVAVRDQAETLSIQDLLRRADEDLYAHKHSRPSSP
jgi:diguanylate cyclase (GGDEF)-like protein/PAS domain S-box-containing protein